MAAGVVAAALIGLPVSVGVAVLAVGVAVGARQPWLVMAAVMVLAGARSDVEDRAYQPLPAADFDGAVLLVTDPEAMGFGWFVEGRIADGEFDGKRVRMTVPWTAGDLNQAVAGSRLEVVGSIASIEENSFVRSRHLVGRLSADSLSVVAEPVWWRQPSELLRERVVAGAEGVPQELRPLYIGLVIGDDREQSIAQQARFRSAGMTHLLAVSGQNVAFVLAVAAPMIKRRSRRGRWVITGCLLVVFALATRMEPSVMRATVSAGIAATAVVSGRRSVGVRTLSLATCGLVVIDPFLVRSIGFVLSVAASLGIVLLGSALVDRIRGPRWFAEGTAITVAAQITVAPLLVASFGPVSLASLPANVATGFAAGVVMTWGSSAGVLVGLLPVSIRPVLSLPATFFVWWIDAVAGWATRLPLPSVAGTGLIALAAGWFGWVVAPGAWRKALAVIAVMVLIAAGSSSSAGPGFQDELHGESRWFPAMLEAPSVLVVAGDARPSLVELIVDRRVVAIDVLVMERGDRRSGDLARAIAEVADVGVILAPPQHRIPGARRVTEPIDLGVVVLDVDVDGRLVVSE